MIGAQLPLGLRLPATSRFDNYLAGPNREAAAAVEQLAVGETAGMLFLAGAAGLGKTHLLQAACRAVESAGTTSAYVPLLALAELDPAALEGLEHYSLLAIDDVQAIAGQPAWEEALFHLYNRQREAGGRLIGAATAPPEHLGLHLPDLRSRLGWGALYVLQPIDDAARLRILVLRARERGLELPEETAQFLLRRYPRDLPVLLGLLGRLDEAALASQRRLTVPFVREVLGSGIG
ncbi:MAG: DnaA regulatory inactivator Hda [Gammaproteobacteria bacterium]